MDLIGLKIELTEVYGVTEQSAELVLQRLEEDSYEEACYTLESIGIKFKKAQKIIGAFI